MTTKERDIYQELFGLYALFKVDILADSMLELLRVQFTPEEADLAVKVGLGGGTLDELQQKTGMERARLQRMLATMADKGTMWTDPGREDPCYRTIGLAGPGLVEVGGWGNIRFADSVQIMKKLHDFEVDFAMKWLPAVGGPVTRVWLTPAALPEDAAPEENAAEVLRQAGPWGISTCSCRLPHWIADPGQHCTYPIETCLFAGEMTRWGLEHGMCREITCEEAIATLRKCNEEGLVHTHNPKEFLCNCCYDCCVFFVGIRGTGAKILRPSEFLPSFDESTCSACGVCEDRCPVDAITLDDFPALDEEKCLGCGVCFPACPTESIQFVRRPKTEHGRATARVTEDLAKKSKETGRPG